MSIILKISYSSRKQIGCHFTSVHFISEYLLVHLYLFNVRLFCFLCTQFKWNLNSSIWELLEQCWWYCQSITTTKLLNLSCISERGSHDNCLQIKFFEIIKNLGYWNYSWILRWQVLSFSSFFFIPIQDSSNKRRNQKKFAISTSNCLNFMKN